VKPFDVLGGKRLAEEITLHFRATLESHRGALLLRLHALGGCRHAEPPGHGGNGAHDVDRAHALGDVFDE
jgi:hypothetical protein